jgi:hypothetical protein
MCALKKRTVSGELVLSDFKKALNQFKKIKRCLIVALVQEE